MPAIYKKYTNEEGSVRGSGVCLQMLVCEAKEILHDYVTRESRECVCDIDRLATCLKFINPFAKNFNFFAYDAFKLQDSLS